jgi:hypothetical protein
MLGELGLGDLKILYMDVCMLLHVNFYASYVMDVFSWRYFKSSFLCNLSMHIVSYSCFFLYIVGIKFYALLEHISIHYRSTFLYIIFRTIWTFFVHFAIVFMHSIFGNHDVRLNKSHSSDIG